MEKMLKQLLEGQNQLFEGQKQLFDGQKQLFDGQKQLFEEVKSIKSEVGSINNRLGSVEKELVTINTRLGSVEKEVVTINTRLGSVEKELVTINTRLDSVEKEVVTKSDMDKNTRILRALEHASQVNASEVLPFRTTMVPANRSPRRWRRLVRPSMKQEDVIYPDLSWQKPLPLPSCDRWQGQAVSMSACRTSTVPGGPHHLGAPLGRPTAHRTFAAIRFPHS